jgi:quinol-cytochrome oxidoreductase complex cytochrome b subunit
VFPFIILSLAILHISLLHESKSTNPIQINTVLNIRFIPYFVYKDVASLLCGF